MWRIVRLPENILKTILISWALKILKYCEDGGDVVKNLMVAHFENLNNIGYY